MQDTVDFITNFVPERPRKGNSRGMQEINPFLYLFFYFFIFIFYFFLTASSTDWWQLKESAKYASFLLFTLFYFLT
jgi:hypothetical protein